MRKAGAYRSSLANRSRRCASRSGGRSICACAGRSRVSPSNVASSSRGIPRPRSFNTWPPTSRPSATLSMKWPRPIACAGRWSSCSRNGSPMRTCMPSIPEPRHRRRTHLGGHQRHCAEALPRPHGPSRGRCRDLHPQSSDVRRTFPTRHPARANLEIENRFVDTFARAIDYLAGNAKRAHPERDRQRGRLQFGLEPIFADP